MGIWGLPNSEIDDDVLTLSAGQSVSTPVPGSQH